MTIKYKQLILLSLVFTSSFLIFSFVIYFDFFIIDEPHPVKISIPINAFAKDCDEIKNCFFPYATIIEINTLVIWKNNDSEIHDITFGKHDESLDHNLKSDILKNGDEFSHKFKKSGTYPYHCSLHTWMNGIIYVN